MNKHKGIEVFVIVPLDEPVYESEEGEVALKEVLLSNVRDDIEPFPLKKNSLIRYRTYWKSCL